jgi:hypothetical protein
MDFFELMPEAAIVNIMMFCKGNDLLKLTETSKRFKEIISFNNKLMAKVCLKVNFDEDAEFAEITKLVKNRKFTAARLIDIHQGLNNSRKLQKVMPLLVKLANCIEDLTIETKSYERGLVYKYRMIIGMFLPKLKKCVVRLYYAAIDDN